MQMLWLFVISGLQCLAVAQESISPMADPALARRINDWIQTALSHTNSERNAEFKTNIPHIIICGDQGVGKSTVLNRLVNAVIFPPRSKSEADQAGFKAKTTIATTVRVQAAKQWSGTIQCTKHSCGGCKARQLSSPDEVDKGIAALQTECFSGEEFVLDHNIEVSVHAPDAQEFIVVDLPGIQQDNNEGHKLTTELTQKWIRKYDNAVIIAVVTGERAFQHDIVRHLEEHPDKENVKKRTMIVATKPNGAEAKIANMFSSSVAFKLSDSPVVALQNADTSDPVQEKWTLAETDSAEAEWFRGSSQLASHTKNWGVGQLRKIASKLFLGSACKAINDIQWKVQERREEVASELSAAQDFDPGRVAYDIGDDTKRYISEMVKSGEIGRKIAEHIQHVKKWADDNIVAAFQQEDGGGLPSIGWTALEVDDPFFRDWLKAAEERLWPELRIQMEQGMRQAFAKSVEKWTGSRPKEAMTFIALTRCEKVKQVSERAVLGQRFMLEDLPTLDLVSAFAQGPLLERISKVVLGVAQQMCLWAPIDNVVRHLQTRPYSDKMDKIIGGANQKGRKEKLQEQLDELDKMLEDKPCEGIQ